MATRSLAENSGGHVHPIAVIGANYWGRRVIRELLDLSREKSTFKIVAVADESAQALSECLNQFGPLDYRLDYQSLLVDQSIEAIHICAPNSTHFKIATDCLNHGKHVLIEKPMTLRSPEAWRVVRLARENNLVLSVGNYHRFNNGIYALRKIISSGTLGRLHYLKLNWTGFTSDITLSVIEDLAPHPFDICNLLLHEWPIKVTCWATGFRAKGLQELATLNLEYGSGRSALIEVSWLDREKKRDVMAVGSDGSAILDCVTERGIVRNREGPTEFAPQSINIVRALITHFSDCISAHERSEKIDNMVDGALGATIVSLMDAAQGSLEKGISVSPRIPNHQRRIVSTGASVFAFEEKPSIENPPFELEANPQGFGDRVSLSELMNLALEARVKGSKHRTTIMRSLAKSDKSPKELLIELRLETANLSKYLRDLLNYGLVEQKTPSNIRKGKIFGLTTRGRWLFQKMQKTDPSQLS